jgi:aerobic carbon-monoxide dehydrogenase large subunit
VIVRTADPRLDPSLVERPAFVGARVPRVEDDRLLRGEGRFVADLALPGMAECVFVRSPLAHARIRSVGLEEARSAPGVLAAVSIDDLENVSPFPHFHTWAPAVPRHLLAKDRVRYVGQPVVAIVAEDRYLAEDAAELVALDLEELPPISSMDAALADGAPLVYDEWGHNRMVDIGGDDPEVSRLLGTHTVVRGSFSMPRHFSVPMETRGVASRFAGGRFAIWSTSQIPHIARTTLAAVLGVSEADVRVIAPDIGGGFGGKAAVYAEEALVPWLARSLGRPVRFIEDRAEHMVASSHARENVHEVEAAVDADGAIVAIRARITYDVGTQQIFPLTLTPSLTGWGVMTGAYRIEHADCRIVNVVTTKTPTGSYRGFGVGEAMFAMERIVDEAARAVGADPVEARRKMLLRPDDLPWTTPSGARIDSGSHLAAFDRCVELTHAALERARRADVQPQIRLGAGFATYIEPTVPTWFGTTGHWAAGDSASVSVDPTGGVTVAVGVQAMGQGAETMVATVAAGELGVPIEAVRVVRGDTDLSPYGLGAWGSRTAAVASGAVVKAAREVRDKAVRIAAHLLEADPSDLVVGDEAIHVRGSVGSSVRWEDVGRTAHVRVVDMPPGEEPGLEATATYDPPFIEHVPDERGRMNACATYANASHGAVVAVDVETGEVRIVDYVVVHDCGTVINPSIVEGQVHGAVAQGIGGALYEAMPYSEDAQPLATTFMDYLVPTATEIPKMTLEHIETPAEGTPFGVKGIGEGGVVGPAPAIANAVRDALDAAGVRMDTTPFGPPAIRRLLREAEGLEEA